MWDGSVQGRKINCLNGSCSKDYDKFNETRLPPKEAFHNNLDMSDISKYDYEHAQKVWKEFKLLNFGEYYNLYLKTDVFLLSNMFEAFRNTCL